MKLNTVEKECLLETAKKVYNSYVALDFFKNYEFASDDGRKFKLFDECQALLSSQVGNKSLIINGKHYSLSVIGEGPKFQIKIESGTNASQNVIKEITNYTDEEVVYLFSSQPFILEQKDDKCYLSTCIQGTTEIGGIGKLDLYRTHLVTLYNIIKKIESEEDISNLLVALTTGSGKTFVQALWMLILNLSGNHAIFSVPDKLLSQFKKDLTCLLPDELVKDVSSIRQGPKRLEDEGLIKNLVRQDVEPSLIIASSEQLLDDHYLSLLEANAVSDNARKIFLSFDEQHLLMKSERRRVRLIELSKRMLTMFLTATPNRETYQLAGCKPVAIMSSGQKEKSGQGQFPVIMALQAENFDDKRKKSSDYDTFFNRLILNFSSAVQEEFTSIAVSVVEDLPFLIHQKTGETAPRWAVQIPMARKMLVIVDDNETLINFFNAFSKPGNYDVYHKGNIIDRVGISEVFGVPNLDQGIYERAHKRKQSHYRNSFPASAKALGDRLSNRSLKDQVRYNIFHAMVEYVLTDLTGLDAITLNGLRKNNLIGFQQLIRDKLTALEEVRDTHYYEIKLGLLLDKKGASEVGPILAGLSGLLHRYAAHDDLKAEFNAYIDNWFLDESILDERIKYSSLGAKFDEYVVNHQIISTMTGMGNAETPLEESKPFLGFKAESYPLYENGTLVDKAKKRKLTAVETLNHESREIRFSPNYINMTEEQADNYFRLGFVGIYVSNKKTEGFNDRNLHTVINLAQEKVSPTNSPDVLIQGIGRNRGLDDTAVPVYVHARGRRQGIFFNLNHLKEDDYYPALFKAQRSYNKEFLAVLGERVGREIIEWFNANIAPDESIDSAQLRDQVLRIIAKALREINDKNDHHIQLSRSQLQKVIGKAIKTLDTEINYIKKPYQLSLFVRCVGSILNFISEIYYTFKRIPAAFRIFNFKHFHPNKTNFDYVYIKLLGNVRYKHIIEKMNIIREFTCWLDAAKTSMMYQLEKEVGELTNALSEEGQLVSLLQTDGLEDFLSRWKISSLIDKNKIITLLPRIASGEINLNEVSPFDIVDKEKVANVFLESFYPVLFHKTFYYALHKLIGSLNKKDLTVLLGTFPEYNEASEAGSQAEEIVQFLMALKKQDKQALKTKFLTLLDTANDIEQSPIFKTMETIPKLLGRILDYHCYYNQHTPKGDVVDEDQVEQTKSLIDAGLSSELRAIRVAFDPYSLMSVLSRKVFFLQGLRNSLPTVSQIYGESHRSRINNLERVRKHILRPLWWSTGLSRTRYLFVKIRRDFAFSLKTTGFAFLNGLKKVANLFTGSYFTLSNRNTISTNYNDSAFAFAQQMNELNPLDAQKVASVNCPSDNVKILERYIVDPKQRFQFFSSVSEPATESSVMPVVAENQARASITNYGSTGSRGAG